ncbi:hypothetical protein ABEG17_06705 [Pedococcus sp. KACC 23699]|uniref:PQQ-binding-like beta-propeller repeat protein n=1 Tax=Pedococcus sp. KACC 23699 TaxID=3149228 RepID=A0AAU7JX77_9MICO
MKRATSIRLDEGATVLCALVVLAVVVFGGYVFVPRDKGLSGDWSAPATDGDVVAGRVLLSGGNAALDLRTGKSVRLGSVVGGTAFYADDRLVVVKGERVDSVALDASARWTWRAAAGHRAIPLAATGDSTLLADCSPVTAEGCRLVGIDRAGRQDWEAPGAQRPVDPPREALPRVQASKVGGGGVLLTDPVSGRTSLQPGDAFVAVPDGPVVVPVVQDGQCVVSLYAAPDPLWTRVLGPCPGGKQPQVRVAPDAVVLQWAGRTERLATTTGATLPPPVPTTVRGVLAAAGSLVATRRVHSPGDRVLLPRHDSQVLELRDATSGEVRARLVTEHPVQLLLLEPRAVVVREGGRIVRYDVDG